MTDSPPIEVPAPRPRAERIPRAELLDDVRGALSASGRGEDGLRVGLEVEAIPVGPDGGRLPLATPKGGGPSTRSLVEKAAERGGWVEHPSTGRSPWWSLPGGASVAFEPGGQIECRTPPLPSPGRAVAMARETLQALWVEAERLGIELVFRGMDPRHEADEVALGLDSPRYRRQLRHYSSIGPWGRRMMLLSAAVHVNVDLGGRAARRWAVANRMAPYLTALFANSTRHAGEDAGVRSARAEQWRRLDPSRTGLFRDEREPAAEYLSFALGARDFLSSPEAGEAVPFRRLWEAGADRASWRAHLSTLFPEVRPRGYLEIRSVDALRPAWLAAPTVLVSGILYDPSALREAQALLPEPDRERLERAGRVGLADPELARVGLQLLDLGLEGAGRMYPDADTAAAREVARAFRDRFTARGRDPGHEVDGLDPFEP